MEELIKQECLERMEMLKLSRQCINAFKKGKIWESEGYGALYELNEEEQKIVDDFEHKVEGYKVYHVIHNMTEFGELYSLLYVSTEKREWKEDRKDIEQGCVFAYVCNKTDEWCSEFGTIGVKPSIGGLVRTS